MLSSLFFGSGGGGNSGGGVIRDEKGARRGNATNSNANGPPVPMPVPSAQQAAAAAQAQAHTNSRSWTSLFLRREKHTSTPDHHDIINRLGTVYANADLGASTSTVSLGRPAVRVRDQTGSSPLLTPKPTRRHSSAQQNSSTPTTTTTKKTAPSSSSNRHHHHHHHHQHTHHSQRHSLPVTSSSSSSKKAHQSLHSLPSANPSPPNIVVGQPTGGYASSKPIKAEPRISFRHSAFGPTLLAQNSLFPKPAAYLYNVRSALSSTMSLSSSSPPPLDPPKRHSKRDRTPSPSRRHPTRKLKAQPSRDVGADPQADIGCPELPTPPDSRRATPAHHHRPRESSRNLSTIKEDTPERTKSRAKKHHRHRTPEEKEERRKRKAREAEEERLEEIRRNRSKTPIHALPEQPTRTPPPPPAGGPDAMQQHLQQQQQALRYTTPVIPPRRDSVTPGQSMLRTSATTIFQALTGNVGSKSSRDQLNTPSPKSSGTRVVLQQTDQAIRVSVDSPDQSKYPHREEGESTDSDESECHTPKGAEFPIPKGPADKKASIQVGSPKVKIVGEDVSEDLSHQTENIDFLLPFGGLREQFDSGYEIEQEVFEDELDGEDTAEDDDTVHAPGSQSTRKKSQGILPALANSVVNVDPLSQQLPVLLSLIDNTVSAYETILETQGSFAVGIGGYQPVARRLLEKVGKIFSRELPSDAATWGETLEYISRRKEVPELPDVDFDDDDAVFEYFDQNDEKMFIYNACLDEPEVLDPCIEGLTRLMDEDVTPEETAIYITSYPHLRPLLLACKYMTDDELDILYSKRAAAFLNVDVAVRSDKQREVTECIELSKGIDETIKQLEATIARMRTTQTNINKRKTRIESHLAVHAPNDDETPVLPAEIQTAIDEIQNEDIIKMEERRQRRKELKKEAEEDDDGDTLLPDDSISQINPYRARYIPQSVTRAYQEAQTRAAASVAQIPASIASTKTSTSILHEYLQARAPPRQTQMNNQFPNPSVPPGFNGVGHPGMMTNGGMMGGNGVVHKKSYMRVPLPAKLYADIKDAVRRLPLHPGNRNLEAIPERGETPDLHHRSVSVSPEQQQQGEQYDDLLHRSSSRSSTKIPSRNVSGASQKKSGFFSKKTVEHEDRSCTPVIIHGAGHGGYNSSKPVVATNETGTVSIKKDGRDKERRRREKGKSSSSRRRESYVERPRK
ncbi:hypothetical protein H072_3777 [Dactylellina haptotyla CBS 200.50]|uniref:Uncharacterized protein n=1 Tax=Dactylellina haptotyla (strain CBS 200.50) TaxID=1284197 RepID=S8AMC6_DACHA|nr:hypothetical protein H072_3777 [Dactylellina haptotyla CBS 200.50]